MKNIGFISASVAMTALSVIATSGCSSWRYRGFLDETMQVSATKASHPYRIDSVTFDNFRLEIASGDGSFTQWVANKVYTPFYDDLSKSDLMNERTYVQDITEATGGFCTEAIDGIPIKVRLAPHREISRGSWSSVYPLAVTLGIVPSEKMCDSLFDIEVSFPDGEPCKTKADLRIDSRFAFSPFGSVRYPNKDGAEACETLAGSFLFSERDLALRKVFVQTVANAVKMAIARRENLAVTDHAKVDYEKNEPEVAFKEVQLIRDDPDGVVTPKDNDGNNGIIITEEQSQDDFFNNN